jgi:hypothetical protein
MLGMALRKLCDQSAQQPYKSGNKLPFYRAGKSFREDNDLELTIRQRFLRLKNLFLHVKGERKVPFFFSTFSE